MKEIKTKQELDEILGSSSKNIFLKVGADFCNPCKLLERTILDIESGYSNDYEFLEINTEEADEALVSYLAIYNIPTSIIFKGGAEVFRHSGLLNRITLIQVLDKFKQ